MISQRRDVLAIVLGLLLTVVVALGILVLVAIPNLRQGAPILTPDGERAVKRAKQQAKQKPLAAAGSTWHGLVAVERLLARLGRRIARLGQRIGRLWAPVSAALHEMMDRLEDRDAAQRNGSGAQTPTAGRAARDHAGTPMRHAAGPGRPTYVEVPRPVEAQEPEPTQQSASPQQSQPTQQNEQPAVKQDRFDVDRIVGRSSVGRPRTMPAISGPIPEITEHQPARSTSSEPGTDPDGRTIDLRDAERSDADQEAGSARRAR